MVRGKIEMKRIENTTNRQVTFSKRRNGLMKKAYELSILCDAQVAVIIFSQKGRLYEFASSDIKKIIERYHKCSKDALTNRIEVERNIQQLRLESASMTKKIELLETHKRKLLGYDLNSCSLEELQSIENQLERSLYSIRLRKAQLLKEHLEQRQAKERKLREENKRLNEMFGTKALQQWEKEKGKENAFDSQRSGQNAEVETRLVIGLPTNAAYS